MNKSWWIAGLLALTSTAFADTCHDNFQSAGDPRNGLFFSSQIKMANLSIQSALGQLQQLASDGGYEVGSQLIQGDSGEASFVQTKNRPPVVVQALAKKTGEVSLSLKLARGQKTDPTAVEKEFCTMLGKLKAGKEGEQIAKTYVQKSRDKVIDGEAAQLSADIGKEVKKALGPIASKGYWIRADEAAKARESREAFAPIRAKYLGRKFRIDGEIYTVSFNQLTHNMEVTYLVTPRRGLLGIRQESRFNSQNFQFLCLLAKDQGEFFLTLSEGSKVTLAGTVTEMRPEIMELSDCRQAN